MMEIAYVMFGITFCIVGYMMHGFSGVKQRTEKVTQEDASVVLNYCSVFNVTLSAEDTATLIRIQANPKDQELNQEDHDTLKRLCCEMITTNPHEGFQDNLWKGPKESAEEILREMDAGDSHHVKAIKEALEDKDE